MTEGRKDDGGKLTVGEIRNILNYDPETGIITWKSSRYKTRIGKEAGNVSSTGYRKIKINKKFYLSHRVAWAIYHGAWPENIIDHIDGSRSNNKIENLRDVTPSANQHNVINPSKKNKHGMLGVSFFASRNKYTAQIAVNGKDKFLGHFDTKEEAYHAYIEAKKIYHPSCMRSLNG